MQSFTDEIRAYIQEAEKGITKDELLYSIKLEAMKYSTLKNTDCSDEMCQFIAREANIGLLALVLFIFLAGNDKTLPKLLLKPGILIFLILHNSIRGIRHRPNMGACPILHVPFQVRAPASPVPD